MPRYTLDTQHFIDVLRDRPAAAEVLEFLHTFVAAVDFHAVVGAALLIGAHGRGEPNAIRNRFIDRFKPHRVITPYVCSVCDVAKLSCRALIPATDLNANSCVSILWPSPGQESGERHESGRRSANPLSELVLSRCHSRTASLRESSGRCILARRVRWMTESQSQVLTGRSDVPWRIGARARRSCVQGLYRPGPA